MSKSRHSKIPGAILSDLLKSSFGIANSLDLWLFLPSLRDLMIEDGAGTEVMIMAVD